MKKRLFKVSAYLFMLITATVIFTFSVSAASHVQSGDFTYYIDGDYAAVTGYVGKSENVVIPSKVGNYTVVKIGDQAFWQKKSIKSISLPSTLLSIGKAAFNECTSLTKLVIPSKVKSISSSAFWYCTSLEQMYIPPSVTAIAATAFNGCKNLTAYVRQGSYAESYLKNQTTVKLAYRYATNLKLAVTSAKIGIGTKTQFKYALSPTPLYNSKVVFTSSDPSVVHITSGGILTALKCGTAVITCKTADGSNITKKATLYVVPQKVTNLAQTNSNPSGFTLTWDKSQGATGYGIYYYSNKKWVLYKTTTATSYTFSGLKVGSSYNFTVVGYTKINGKNFVGLAADYITASVMNPGVISNLKATSTENSVTLSWSAAPCATGYNVFSYNEETKKHEYIGKTEKLTATIKNLEPDSKYIYAIRAYLNYGGKTIHAEKYVTGITVYTVPGTVKGFGADSREISQSSIRLTWDKLPYCSGYELFTYDKNASSKYSLIASLDNNSITGFTVSGLKGGTNYSFTIRAYSLRDGKKVYGKAISPVTICTAMLPTERKGAFDGFISALNASKNSNGDFYLIKATQAANLQGSFIEECSDILNSIATDDVSKHYFKNGREEGTDRLVGDYIYPFEAESRLKMENVKNTVYHLDGNGYRIEIELDTENRDAPVNSLIAPVIDWGVIAGQYKGFVINQCLYEGTQIEAKVNGGKIEYMTITMPVSFSFRWGGAEYQFSETIIHNYIFSW